MSDQDKTPTPPGGMNPPNIPPSAAMEAPRPKAAVEAEKRKAEPTQSGQFSQDQLVEILAKVRAIRLNAAKDVVFAIPRNPFERESDFVLSLTRRSPVAVFGQE